MLTKWSLLELDDDFIFEFLCAMLPEYYSSTERDGGELNGWHQKYNQQKKKWIGLYKNLKLLYVKGIYKKVKR